MIDANLRKHAEEALFLANELGETWTNTTIGNIIDFQKDRLRNALLTDSEQLVNSLLLDLGQTLDHAEKGIDEY